MPLNRKPLSIILDRNKIILLLNTDFKFVHANIALFVICCVDKDFVVYLV